MPSATKELRDAFPDSDQEALLVLRDNFNFDRGLISPKKEGYEATHREWQAVNYLVYEWDYAYEPNKQDLI